MDVLILSGPPGAGKTTAAAALAARSERAVHVHGDTFFDFVASGFVEPWKPESHAQNATVLDAIGAAAAVYADGGYLTIVEGIVIPRFFLTPLADALRSRDHQPSYAVLRAPLDVCLQRRTEQPPAVVEQLWREFADLGDLERHVVAGVDELERRFRAGDLRLA